MIFVNLIYRHFDILMPQYGQAKKVVHFRAVPKWCYGYILLGLESQIPLKHVWVPPVSMNTPQIPPDKPQIPPRHLQGTQDINRRQQTTTDDNRGQQTPSDTDRCFWVCSEVSVGACCRLLTSWVPWRYLGVVLGMSGWCLGVSE